MGLSDQGVRRQKSAEKKGRVAEVQECASLEQVFTGWGRVKVWKQQSGPRKRATPPPVRRVGETNSLHVVRPLQGGHTSQRSAHECRPTSARTSRPALLLPRGTGRGLCSQCPFHSRTSTLVLLASRAITYTALGSDRCGFTSWLRLLKSHFVLSLNFSHSKDGDMTVQSP